MQDVFSRAAATSSGRHLCGGRVVQRLVTLAQHRRRRSRRTACPGACAPQHGDRGAAVAERLACSPPTKVNRVQSPAGSLPDFRMWESCRTMPLTGGFPQGSPVPPLHSSVAPYSPQSHSSGLKSSLEPRWCSSYDCSPHNHDEPGSIRVLTPDILTPAAFLRVSAVLQYIALLPTRLEKTAWVGFERVKRFGRLLAARSSEAMWVIECGGGREIAEKTRRPAALSGTIRTCENPGVTRPGIEPGSPWWEASRLTGLDLRPMRVKRDEYGGAPECTSGKREIPEKTRQPATSSGTIPTAKTKLMSLQRRPIRKRNATEGQPGHSTPMPELGAVPSVEQYLGECIARAESLHTGGSASWNSAKLRDLYRLFVIADKLRPDDVGLVSYAGSGPMDGGKTPGLRRLDDGKMPEVVKNDLLRISHITGLKLEILRLQLVNETPHTIRNVFETVFVRSYNPQLAYVFFARREWHTSNVAVDSPLFREAAVQIPPRCLFKHATCMKELLARYIPEERVPARAVCTYTNALLQFQLTVLKSLVLGSHDQAVLKHWWPLPHFGLQPEENSDALQADCKPVQCIEDGQTPAMHTNNASTTCYGRSPTGRDAGWRESHQSPVANDALSLACTSGVVAQEAISRLNFEVLCDYTLATEQAKEAKSWGNGKVNGHYTEPRSRILDGYDRCEICILNLNAVRNECSSSLLVWDLQSCLTALESDRSRARLSQTRECFCEASHDLVANSRPNISTAGCFCNFKNLRTEKSTRGGSTTSSRTTTVGSEFCTEMMLISAAKVRVTAISTRRPGSNLRSALGAEANTPQPQSS
ncbi:hypothetical protein PR048_003073 [Dryococelus australis]|uniref:Uncharacterized protein n=1 Tax=Dryococelus australis TaxID=614101 RepID=A0ABQ9ILY7_9NEOP|nr:hypothetical protein PR048_003073 [Dryococelus australis]